MKPINNTKKKRNRYSPGGISKSGKKVQSNAENEIANYLDRIGIPYTKPKKAFKGEYYKNYKFIPDFIIDGVIIEFFGIKGDEDYERTKQLKKENQYENRKYKFLNHSDEIGSLCTRFKHLIGKNPQGDLNKFMKSKGETK